MHAPHSHHLAAPRHSLLASLAIVTTLALGLMELFALQRARLRSRMLRL